MTISCAPPLTPELDLAVAELERVCDLLLAFAGEARGLAAGTDWQARAATEFHDRADRWAGDVSSLGCLAESARHAAVSARAAARELDVWGCP